MDSSTASQPRRPFDPALLPGPLFDLLQRHEWERDSLRRTWLLIDTLEWVVKWHTILCLSDLLREANLSPRMKVLLSSGLRTPSLGMWNMFFREAMKGIRNPSLPWDQWQRLTAMEERHGRDLARAEAHFDCRLARVCQRLREVEARLQELLDRPPSEESASGW